MSATKKGEDVVAPDSVAVLPNGLPVRVHEYVSASPSASVDPLPFRVTVEPTPTVWFGPALATGAELMVLTVTLALELPVPLLTVSWIT
jgi:hypothetical protein